MTRIDILWTIVDYAFLVQPASAFVVIALRWFYLPMEVCDTQALSVLGRFLVDLASES